LRGRDHHSRWRKGRLPQIAAIARHRVHTQIADIGGSVAAAVQREVAVRLQREEVTIGSHLAGRGWREAGGGSGRTGRRGMAAGGRAHAGWREGCTPRGDTTAGAWLAGVCDGAATLWGGRARCQDGCAPRQQAPLQRCHWVRASNVMGHARPQRRCLEGPAVSDPHAATNMAEAALPRAAILLTVPRNAHPHHTAQRQGGSAHLAAGAAVAGAQQLRLVSLPCRAVPRKHCRLRG
jgi:hypothetical protein